MNVKAIIKTKGNYVPTVKPNVSIRDVLLALETEDVGALVVTEDGNSILGIISERDIVRGLRVIGDNVLDSDVEDLMTRDVITCSIDDRIAALIGIMLTNHIRHIPVLDAGKLIGFINIRDILQRRLEEVQADADALQKYIHS